MTQEDKELLLKDLCARLPYHVRCKVWLKDGTIEEGLLDLQHNYGDVLRDAFYYNKIKDIKPYLRSMSSMTTDEEYEYHQIRKRNSNKSLSLMDCSDHLQQLLFPIIVGTETIDWLNSHHFDYRGLIPKGLAIKAPKGMYN